ncbi:MAG TPA: hypothetical protein VLC09_19035 [Polyangiaceae bacterium]|nr:hypothetical protein [Polyangiaceae bacterium]
MTKRVWILGSGFSRPLGGPLLADLFSPRFQAMVRASFPSIGNSQEASLLYGFYRFGLGQGQFAHAEDFLVQLDDSALVLPVRRRLSQLYTSFVYQETHKMDPERTLDEVREHARRVVAAECGMHVPDVIGNDERFLTYQDWATGLTGDDSVVSFNYDLLLERLIPGPRLNVIGLDAPKPSGFPKLHKMHGSLDWYADDPLEQLQAVSRTPGATDPPIVGVPGATKYGLSQSPLFTRIWGSAAAAIREAEEIYIIGYSMPESDQYASRWLCEGVRDNTSAHLNIELVLGPPGFATRRLDEVLSLALGGRTDTRTMTDEYATLRQFAPNRPKEFAVRTRHMYAQDFLAAWRP